MTNPLLDPELITAAEFDRVGGDAQRLLATKNDTIIFPGEAIVPLEGIARSLGSPGITALNIVTSPYGRYFGRWLADSGATVVEIVAPDGEAVRVDAVAKALESNPDISVVAFVHAEAIGGVVNDAASISRLARDHGAVVALDAVASFGAEEVLIDEWGIDVVVVGPQKALAGPSGVSLVAVSDRAWEWFSENSVAPRHSSLSLLDWKVSWLDTERAVVPVHPRASRNTRPRRGALAGARGGSGRGRVAPSGQCRGRPRGGTSSRAGAPRARRGRRGDRHHVARARRSRRTRSGERGPGQRPRSPDGGIR